jgi:hypothetical protein
MKIISKIIILFSVGFWSFCASAQYVTQNVTSSSGEFGWGSEGFYFQVSTPFSTGCPITNFAVIQSDHPLFKQNIAFILMAITTQSTLRITVNGCYNNRPKVVAVGISNS